MRKTNWYTGSVPNPGKFKTFQYPLLHPLKTIGENWKAENQIDIFERKTWNEDAIRIF